MHGVKLERLEANADWIHVGSALGEVCNAWSGRYDLTVYMGRDGGQGHASAFFLPDSGQIEINSKDAFGALKAGQIGDLRQPRELAKYPVCGGLAMHEAMHARYSTSDLAVLEKRMTKTGFEVLQLLEETRIEGRGIMVHPRDRGFLRSSCLSLVVGEKDPADPESKASPRKTAVLVIGRQEVGVLEPEDAAPVEAWLTSNGWSTDVLTRLRQIVSEFKMLDDSGDDLSQQIRLANELDKLMPEDPKGDGGDGESNASGEDGEPGDPGKGSASSAPPSGNGGLDKILEEILGKAAEDAAKEVWEEAGHKQSEAERKAAQEAQREQDQNNRKANQVFRDLNGHIAPVPRELAGARPPTTRERGSAVLLSKALERARYRDREVSEFFSNIPPGRLHGGEAMRRTAARWAGAPASGYTPFKRRERHETEQPRLTVGMMSDVSGSMSGVQANVGVANYVISEAVYRLDDAFAAQVYFGSHVSPGLRRGERLREVRTWQGGGAYEDFDGGFRALDGELNLISGHGARLLVVASDAQFKNSPFNQNAARDKWLNICARKGVAVVWLHLKGQDPALGKRIGLRTVEVGPDVLEATSAIGSACIEALAQVSGV